MEIKCFTDGSCLQEEKYKKVGVGAWAYKIIINEDSYINCGTQIETTSNLMEIEAIKQLLLHLNNLKNDLEDVQVIILSDCQSVVNIINDFITEGKIKAKVREIYDEVLGLIKTVGLKISLKWIKAHNSKNPSEYSIHNNVVDKLARKTARMLTNELNGMNNKSKKRKKPKDVDARKILTKQPIDMEKYIQYNKLIIPHVMVNSRPKESKRLNKYNKYKANNGIEKAIEVEQRGKKYIIVDGYISYLWLIEKGEYWIPINIVG
jgi:ribonuclease HI